MKDTSKAKGVLPNDPGELKALLRIKEQRIAVLEEQLQLLRHKRFGASSEKAPSDQLNLFNEAEATTDAPPDTVGETTIPEHKRKKRGRKAIDEKLPRVIVEHDIPEAEKICACGCQKTRIGEDASEQLGFLVGRLRLPDPAEGSGVAPRVGGAVQQKCSLQICLPVLRRH